MIPAISHALGLGEIEVDSALNQPLKAEIGLVSATPSDLQTLRVGLASSEVFQRVGIDRPYILNELKFEAVLNADGEPVIMVTSMQPVREPFLNFLIEIRWPKGRLLREYTVLLDPPVFLEQRRAAAAAAPQVSPESSAPKAAPAPVPSAPTAQREPAAAAPAPVAEREPEFTAEPTGESVPQPTYEPEAPAPVVRTEPAPRAESAPVILPAPQDEYRYGAEDRTVTATEPLELFPRIPIDGAYATATATDELMTEKGDTLWEIAQQARPDESVSVPQMMMALLRANPDAFYNENINNLKSGYILRIPATDEIAALSRAEAVAEVREQNALWREYRSQVAGQAVPQAVASVPAADDTSAQDGMAEPAAGAADAEGRLELLGTEETVVEDGGQVVAEGEDTAEMQREVALLRERLESRRMENEELQSRVEDLEQTLERKDRLIELRSEQLQGLQTRVDESAAPATEPSTPAQEMPVEEAPVDEAPAEGVTEEPAAEAPAPEQAPATEEETPVAEQAPVMSEEEPAFEPEEQAPVQEERLDTAKAPAPVPEPQVTPPQPAAQPSFIEDLLANPSMLMAIGFGGLLVIGLVALLLRRGGKKGKADTAAAATAPAAIQEAEEAFAAPTPEPEPAAEAPRAAPGAEPEPVVEAGEPDLEAGLDFETPEPTDFDSTQALPEPSAAPAAGEGEIETDDTTEEADVYIAYGLYQQAEDLLKTAISDNPEKPVYRLKLAETHFAAKDTAAFEEAARELHDIVGESSPMWARVAAMGKELNSNNPLFTGTDTGGFSAADFEHAKPDTADIDLGADLEERAAAGEESFDLGEELDLGDFDLGEESESKDEGVGFAGADQTLAMDMSGALEEAPEEGLDLGDFETELELGETPAGGDTESTGESPSVADETGELEFDLSEFDLGGEEAETPVSDTEGAGEALDIGLDLDTSEFDLGAEEPAAESPAAGAAVDETLELDVGDLDFGLSEEETTTAETPSTDFAAEESEAISGGDEVSTKLDLAKAYIDMGDDEGARSTLEEVMSEGNDAQKQEAQELLNQIG